jgi:uncharacterized repeat protein (TIGR01451 family)
MKRFLRVLASLSSSSILLGSYLLVWLPPARAQISVGNVGCPAGTREGFVSAVQNPTFSTNAGTGNGTVTSSAPSFNPFPSGLSFTSDLPYRGDAVYPNDPGGGGLSIQDERFNGGAILSAPAGVVQGRGVTAAEATLVGIDPVAIPTYLYSNPNLRQDGVTSALTGLPPVIWQQTVSGLRGSTVYNFKALFFNLLLPGAPGLDPRIRLRIIGAGTIQSPIPIVVGNPGTSIPGFSNIPNNRQSWIPVQFSFITEPGQISATLQIVDETQDISGDDFGVTAIGLRECTPNVGVAKSAGNPSQNPDGSYTIPYTVIVKNLAPAGNPDPYVLSNLQLAENLSSTFANARIVSIGNLQSPTLNINPSFNGISDTRLLRDDVNSLAAGQSASVTFNVTIFPGTGLNGSGPYVNSVVATATGNSGVQVLDRSNDGTNPDPNNNGDGSDNDIPTIVKLPGLPSVVLLKRLTNVTRGGVSLPSYNFGAFTDDLNTADDNLPNWSQLLTGAPLGLLTLNPQTPAQAGDVVEYTIYFLSNGAVAAPNANICDAIPPGTTLVIGSNQAQVGTSAIRSAGTFFSPLAPLPSNNPCENPNNPNGSLIFDLGTLPITAPNNIGFVRFQVRVE